MEDRKNELEKNAILNLLKTLSTIVFPLITFPYASRVLGAINIGRINYSISVVSYFSLIASLGISVYGIRECSKVRNNQSKLEEVASELFTINLITTAASYTILIIVIYVADFLISYRTLLILQAFTILFTTLGADWINTAFEDFQYLTIRSFAMQFLAMILMLIFVRKPEDYYIYVVISLISSCGAQLINVFYRKKYCRLRLRISYDSKRHVAPILSLFAMLLSQQIYSYLDVTIIGVISGDYAVGIYSTAAKIIGIITQVIASIAWVVMPQMSFAFSNQDFIKVKELASYSLGFSAIIGLPSIAGILVFSYEIISIVAGKEYIEASLCMKILLFSMLCSCISNVTGNELLLAAGKEKPFMAACILGAVVNAITNVIFIPRWGIEGAAFTTFLSNLVILLVTLVYIDREAVLSKLEIRNCIKGTPLGSALVLCICILVKLFVSNKYLGLAIATLLSCIVYLLVLLLFRNSILVGMIDKLQKGNRWKWKQ